MNLITTLDDIGVRCGTDKSSKFHGYLDLYDELLSTLRTQPVSLLEIGIAGGESIRMWEEYFTHPHARIYGVDIHDRQLDPFDQRTKCFITDATSPNAVFDITGQTGPLDIWVDDGSHYSVHQKQALELWWPHIKPGGLAIIEDTHTSYKYPWTIPDEVSFVDSMISWIHRMNEHGKDDCGKSTDSDIDQIIFQKSLVVIKKR